MVITCFVCGKVLETDRPSRLIRHGNQAHDRDWIDFTCTEPGCWDKHLGVITALEGIEHYCGHLSRRNPLQVESDSEDEEESNEEEMEAYFRAEEEMNPTGEPLDAWMLDDAFEKELPPKSNFTNKPRAMTEAETVEFDFLRYSIKHAQTHQAHRDLFQTKLMKQVCSSFPSPDTLKRRAWRYMTEIGLDVEDRSMGKFREPVPPSATLTLGIFSSRIFFLLIRISFVWWKSSFQPTRGLSCPVSKNRVKSSYKRKISSTAVLASGKETVL